MALDVVQWNDDAGGRDEGILLLDGDRDDVVAGGCVVAAGKLDNVAATQHGDEVLKRLCKVLAVDIGDQAAIAFAKLGEEIIVGISTYVGVDVVAQGPTESAGGFQPVTVAEAKDGNAA